MTKRDPWPSCKQTVICDHIANLKVPKYFGHLFFSCLSSLAFFLLISSMLSFSITSAKVSISLFCAPEGPALGKILSRSPNLSKDKASHFSFVDVNFHRLPVPGTHQRPKAPALQLAVVLLHVGLVIGKVLLLMDHCAGCTLGSSLTCSLFLRAREHHSSCFNWK